MVAALAVAMACQTHVVQAFVENIETELDEADLKDIASYGAKVCTRAAAFQKTYGVVFGDECFWFLVIGDFGEACLCCCLWSDVCPRALAECLRGHERARRLGRAAACRPSGPVCC
jgi:hypothetical protein